MPTISIQSLAENCDRINVNATQTLRLGCAMDLFIVRGNNTIVVMNMSLVAVPCTHEMHVTPGLSLPQAARIRLRGAGPLDGRLRSTGSLWAAGLSRTGRRARPVVGAGTANHRIWSMFARHARKRDRVHIKIV